MTKQMYTDWLATCANSYGFGHTEGQAIAEMAGAYTGRPDVPVEAKVVEFRGEGRAGPTSYNVEDFVSGKVVEVPPDEFKTLAEASRDLEIAVDAALVSADQEEIEE